jgi:hypothetical protein
MTIDIDLRCYLRNLLTGAWASTDQAEWLGRHASGASRF